MDSRIEERLDLFFLKNQIALGTKCSEKDIKLIENSLGEKLSDTHKEFLLKYGGSIVGDLAIYGLINSELMDENTVVELTESFVNDGVRLKKGQYVFSYDGSGNPIIQDTNGQILFFDHDIGEFEVLAVSLHDLIDENLPD